MSFQPSRYQQAIFDHIAVPENGHLLVNALAGAAKTSTLIAALHRQPEERIKRTLLCAFNTSIKDELAARSPKGATIKTIHSIGYSTLGEHFAPGGKWGIRVEGAKYRLLLDRYLTIYPLPVELEGGYEDEQRKSRRDTLLQLLDLVRLTLTDTSDEAAVVALAEGYDLEVWDPKSVAQTLRTILKWGIEGMPEEHLDGDDEASPEVHGARWSIDFADMIWLPYAMNLQPRQFALVLVDEVQDLSAAQRELVLKCVEADGMLVMVGDPHQAIYAFAGADARSWEEIRERVRPTELPLSICYRCPKAVIQEAQEIVPEIECAPDAFDGSVERIEQRDLFNFVRPGDMVLCRTTAPLVGCCLQLLQRGTAAVVKGRDVAKTLRRILEWCEKQPTFKFTRIGVLAEEWQNQQWLRIKDQPGADAKLASMADAVECLVAIWSSVMDNGGASCHALRAKLDGLFTDNDMKNVVSLSTIHRAKGLEQKTVFLLRPDLLPHPMAKTPTARAQERNLKYVAITRAKEALFIVLPPPRN